MKVKNDYQVACSLNSPSNANQKPTKWRMFAMKILMVCAFFFLLNNIAFSTLLAPGCYLEYNACIKAGGDRSACYAAFVNCVNRLTDYAPGFDGPLGKYGQVVRAYNPGSTLDIGTGRFNFQANSYMMGMGTVTTVTFVYVATDVLYAADDMSTVEWTVIGPGIFNPMNSLWEINWLVPGGPAPMGYEVAAIIYDPELPQGFVIGGFHAQEAPVVVSRMAVPELANASAAGSFAKSSAAVRAYPVPATQLLSLQLDVAADAVYEIQLTDLTGRVVLQLMAATPLQRGRFDRSFDISALPAGQYFYHVHGATTTLTGKCLKE